MKRTTFSLLFLLSIVVDALAEEINITVKGTTDKASKEVIVFWKNSRTFMSRCNYAGTTIVF